MNEAATFKTYIDEQESGIWRFQRLLPQIKAANRVTLGEGRTPLVKSRAIAEKLGLSALYFKLEGTNPTGSYKDRISAMGVARALEAGKPGCIGTSSGNAGASVAAYAASARLPYRLLVLEHVLEAKIKQAMLHGAWIQKIKGFGTSTSVGEKVFDYIKHMAEENDWEIMITAYLFNPMAMEAVKTIAYELYEQLGYRTPDVVYAPVGGGGLFTGVYNGFQDLKRIKASSSVPSVVAVQSEGCSNIVRAWEQGSRTPAPGDSTSAISGLQVPNPPDGLKVLEAMHSGGGWGERVQDEDVWAWQETLAAEEGIWCEPASAVSLAGLSRSLEQDKIGRDQTIVCLLTGAGFKDNERTEAMIRQKPEIQLYDIDELGGSV